MALAAPLVPRDVTPPPPKPAASRAELIAPRFQDLVVSRPPRRTSGGSLTGLASLLIHAVLLAVVIVVPLLRDDLLPESDRAVRAFFVTPAEAPPPPPPPPPPAAGARVTPSAPVARSPVQNQLVAPLEIPDQVKPDEGIDLGVPGGVEGGVPGGVVGGIVGGLPDALPPAPPSRVVRVGGSIHAPKLIQRVDPQYPPLAREARVSGMVILEALVGEDGRVKSVKVLRGHPLLEEAALEAVRQWRYKPLLLNGQTQEFVLTVTVNFHLTSGAS